MRITKASLMWATNTTTTVPRSAGLQAISPQPYQPTGCKHFTRRHTLRQRERRTPRLRCASQAPRSDNNPVVAAAPLLRRRIARGLSSIAGGDRRNAWLAAYRAARVHVRTIGRSADRNTAGILLVCQFHLSTNGAFPALISYFPYLRRHLARALP